MNHRGIFTFTLLLVLIPLYLTLADFELEKVSKEQFTETVLMELERSNYIRTEMEINTDKIIKQTLEESLRLRQAGESVQTLAQTFNIAIPEEIVADPVFHEGVKAVIALRLYDYYRDCESIYPVKFNAFGPDELANINEVYSKSTVEIDPLKNHAEFSFSHYNFMATIAFEHVEQKFKVPQGYQISAEGV